LGPLIRFDPVYVGHFKCNIRRIADYPRLSDYMRTLFQIEGVAATVNLGHIKRHYYQSHRNLNPSGIVPAGPELAFVSRGSADPDELLWPSLDL
jgi:glutathionyl-hydroquinone reductase